MKPGRLVSDVKDLRRNTDIWVAGKLNREELKSFVDLENGNLEVIFGQYPRLQSGVKIEKRVPREDTPLVAT